MWRDIFSPIFFPIHHSFSFECQQQQIVLLILFLMVARALLFYFKWFAALALGLLYCCFITATTAAAVARRFSPFGCVFLLFPPTFYFSEKQSHVLFLFFLFLLFLLDLGMLRCRDLAGLPRCCFILAATKSRCCWAKKRARAKRI